MTCVGVRCHEIAGSTVTVAIPKEWLLLCNLESTRLR